MKTLLCLTPNKREEKFKKITKFKHVFQEGILKTKISLVLFFLFFTLGSYAQSDYSTQTGVLGTTYSWIDCSSGTRICNGDDVRSTVSWPFDFNFYGSSYTTGDNMSVTSNGFVRFDGSATTSYSTARSYSLTSSATNLGQIVAVAVYDCNPRSGWIRYLVTGTAPNRVLTIK